MIISDLIKYETSIIEYANGDKEKIVREILIKEPKVKVVGHSYYFNTRIVLREIIRKSKS